LSRGYNREKKGLVWVDVNSNPKNVGDEPSQIKQKFPDSLVVVSESRRKGIEQILEKHPETEVILMDDGFQHRWVKAGMNILLNNYENTIYSDSLLPLGKLRESKKETSRADIIITTKCPEMTPIEKIGINNQLN
ncbi:MAG: tetraacyldisaccharide 4'-kinase, partial [Flavobacteriales bacterium]